MDLHTQGGNVIKVLLVDDHPVVRSGYLRLLSQEQGIQVVAEASNTEQGYQAYVQHEPDVTVTDVSMPGVGGLALLQKILQREPGALVLVCSMYDSAQLVHRAMQSGAKGFVSKNAEPDELVQAVKAVFAGEHYLSLGLEALETAGEHDAEAQRIAELSAREYEIFRLLAQGHTVSDCAQLLHISQKTISNNQTHIKEKLQVESMAALVHLAQRHKVIDNLV
jgi:DNA-binding NarL/FixJ family response regulator